MQSLLTNKTASITEFRDPSKVIDSAGGEPVAVLNRNRVVGYFVPVEAVEKLSFESTGAGEAKATIKKRKPAIASVLKYLEDK
ncbi:prevent-host-death family protein [Exilibacterium tricleocarpae]|uniref:Prevent-host-death family protein n=1 Tax=Exilibacterium tricleocarpae TaxID=2591008 RepID=A0A545U444_9GAMM|nr:prevent-host-death family protein [Exilibacterium tricleocarpae]